MTGKKLRALSSRNTILLVLSPHNYFYTFCLASIHTITPLFRLIIIFVIIIIDHIILVRSKLFAFIIIVVVFIIVVIVMIVVIIHQFLFLFLLFFFSSEKLHDLLRGLIIERRITNIVFAMRTHRIHPKLVRHAPLGDAPVVIVMSTR